HRAVLNIVTNALDAVDGTPNAKIILQTALDREHHRLVVTIADNGPGIPEDAIPKLFNIFESTKGSRGTGLGLSVSQKIIREHGGDIFLTSREGVGTTFRLEWPYLEEDKNVHESQTLA
ncbi:MAG: ATP-binding protein, partial [Planctomycetaceae bacterium]|nr:ATP-binding protein [Planctomycetaceae bacterium]